MRHLNRSDLERLDTNESVLEVVVLWGEQSVLHLAHLSPPHTFCVGDAVDRRGKLATDFLIGRDSLGSERLPITLAGSDGPVLVVPDGASIELTRAGLRLTRSDLLAQGLLTPCRELHEALQCSLPAGSSARLQYRGFTFLVTPTRAAQRIGVGGAPRVDWKQNRYTLGSIGFHAALLSLFYFLPPSSSALAIDRLSTDSRMVAYELDAREDLDDLPLFLKDANDNASQSSEGKREKGDEGKIGDAKAPKTKHKCAVAGPADNPNPVLARDEAKALAENAGIIGILKANIGSWNSPTSPYGKTEALGSDPESAIGALIGDAIGSNHGADGLGMIGTGRHGGGPALGTIGVGNVATLGRTGRAGYTAGAGGFRGRDPRVPPQWHVKIDVRGSLSKEVIRRVIHQHLSEVRFCYEQELRSRPDLQGRVAIQFIIAPTGAVQAAAAAHSDLDSPRVNQCIVHTVQRWSFPAPEGGGVVVVTYPFVLQQTGS